MNRDFVRQLGTRVAWKLHIGESPSICPFLKNNGHEAPKGPSASIFQEWTDTRTFSYLKYTLIYNYV